MPSCLLACAWHPQALPARHTSFSGAPAVSRAAAPLHATVARSSSFGGAAFARHLAALTQAGALSQTQAQPQQNSSQLGGVVATQATTARCAPRSNEWQSDQRRGTSTGESAPVRTMPAMQSCCTRPAAVCELGTRALSEPGALDAQCVVDEEREDTLEQDAVDVAGAGGQNQQDGLPICNIIARKPADAPPSQMSTGPSSNAVAPARGAPARRTSFSERVGALRAAAAAAASRQTAGSQPPASGTQPAAVRQQLPCVVPSGSAPTSSSSGGSSAALSMPQATPHICSGRGAAALMDSALDLESVDSQSCCLEWHAGVQPVVAASVRPRSNMDPGLVLADDQTHRRLQHLMVTRSGSGLAVALPSCHNGPPNGNTPCSTASQGSSPRGIPSGATPSTVRPQAFESPCPPADGPAGTTAIRRRISLLSVASRPSQSPIHSSDSLQPAGTPLQPHHLRPPTSGNRRPGSDESLPHQFGTFPNQASVPGEATGAAGVSGTLTGSGPVSFDAPAAVAAHGALTRGPSLSCHA